MFTRESTRAFTLVEALVLLAIAALLVALLMPALHGPPPLTDADLDFTSWDPGAESKLAPPHDIVAANVNLAGEWWQRTRAPLGLVIASGDAGRWRVTFHSRAPCGFSPSVLLERTATYEEGTLILDRPVQDELRKTTFARFYVARIHGREYLIPSIKLDKLKEILKLWTDREQADELQSEVLTRLER
jgi:hypothetical protein